jgi:hypothetical protein
MKRQIASTAHRQRYIAALFGVVAAIMCMQCSPSPVFVEDRADLLDSAAQERIVQMCASLLDEIDIHILTVILEGAAADINAEAVSIFDQARLGDKTGGARGLLLLIDANGAQVRLEVGYDLEGIFTDAIVGYIERSQMVPFFQTGRIGSGIEATVELLVAQAMGDSEFVASISKQISTQTDQHLSGGAGARTDVHIGSGRPGEPSTDLADALKAQATPLQTLDQYMLALALHVKEPDLRIYTPETRKFFRNWLVTDGQQDNALKILAQNIKHTKVVIEGGLAVIYFPNNLRQANPYFLQQGDEGWMIDFAGMNKIVGFNHKNQWYFRSTDHLYMFAFQAYRFDRNGFPHPRQQ